MTHLSPASVGAGTSFRDRGARFIERVKALRHLTGGHFGAAMLILRIRLAPNHIHTVFYHGKPVAFRSADELALREVLVNEEYSFLTERLRGLARPKVIDLGAHIGTFAIWLTTVSSTADVISVEADPETFELTKRNWMQLGLAGHVIHRAGSARDEEILSLSVAGPTMSHRVDRSGEIKVKGISLATLVKMSAGDRGRIDLVKVDIEGSEEALICSAPAILRRIDALVVELHPGLCNTARVRDILAMYYAVIVDIPGRTSSKPLLYCEGSLSPGHDAT